VKSSASPNWPPAEAYCGPRRAAGKVVCTEDVNAAAAGGDLLYTDVWVSTGKEAELA
jgi:ornithine carbamoyltransferase